MIKNDVCGDCACLVFLSLKINLKKHNFKFQIFFRKSRNIRFLDSAFYLYPFLFLMIPLSSLPIFSPPPPSLFPILQPPFLPLPSHYSFHLTNTERSFSQRTLNIFVSFVRSDLTLLPPSTPPLHPSSSPRLETSREFQTSFLINIYCLQLLSTCLKSIGRTQNYHYQD